MMVGEQLKIRFKERDRGFTLIEVVIAMFCFSIIALATFRMTATGWRATDFSRSKTEASIMAAQHLEMMFSEKYASSQASGMSDRLTAGDHAFTSNGYNISYTVADGVVLPDSKFVQMTVIPAHMPNAKGVTYNYLLPMRK